MLLFSENMLVSKQEKSYLPNSEKKALASKGKIRLFGFFRVQQYIRKQLLSKIT